jgi:tRNA G18 (ribose-2'-O)-methylase SpoU
MTRGYFAVGIYGCKTEANVGTLWRTATLYEAAFVFTIGHRYKRQSSDTPKTPLHTPLFHFSTVDDLIEHLPWSCPLVGVELDERSKPLSSHSNNWERCAYLLGAEDHGLPPAVLDKCHSVLQIETAVPRSMNVAVAGSIILHDRYVKRLACSRERAA